MSNPPPYLDAGDASGATPDQELTSSTPRWVKVFGIIAIVVVLLFAILLVAGGGRHGPGRHRLSDGAPGGQTPPTDTESQRTLPQAGRS